MNFTGSSQKNTLSGVSVLQPKALHFRYFILKVPCFLQLFGRPQMTNIILQDQFHHLFYQDRVKKRFFWYYNSFFFKTHKWFFFHKFRLSLRNFLTQIDVFNCLKSLQHAPTQERYYFIKRCLSGSICSSEKPTSSGTISILNWWTTTNNFTTSAAISTTCSTTTASAASDRVSTNYSTNGISFQSGYI